MLTLLPEVTTRQHSNEFGIERIGTSHPTVSEQAELITKGSGNHVEIEHIATSHTPVCQLAAQVWVVAGQRATRKDNQMNIVRDEAKAEPMYVTYHH